MRLMLLTPLLLVSGLWGCGTVTESPQPKRLTSAAVQETQQENNKERKEEPSMENLEDDCD